MSVDAESGEAEEAGTDQARIKSGETRSRRTRAKIFSTFLRLARTSDRQISATTICTPDPTRKKEKVISQAAFYNQFPRGVSELLTDTCEQIANAAINEVGRQQRTRAKTGVPVLSQVERVTITATTLVRMMKRYPNLFNVDGKIPRQAVVNLSEALSKAILEGEDYLTPEQQEDGVRMAKYHAAALVGVLRTDLGEELKGKDEYYERLARVMVAQIVPVLMTWREPEVRAVLDGLPDVPVPNILRITELSAYQKVMDMQQGVLRR